jgi:hypothetical protein
MKEATATYHAPKGDSKVVEMLGHTFYDGKPETVVLDDLLMATLQGNQHFECSEPKEHKPDRAQPESKQEHKDKGR